MHDAPRHPLTPGLWLQLLQQDVLRDDLVRSITELKREAARYNTPATYAQCAKYQRQINAKEKQLAALESAGASKSAWEDRVIKVVSSCKVRMLKQAMPGQAVCSPAPHVSLITGGWCSALPRDLVRPPAGSSAARDPQPDAALAGHAAREELLGLRCHRGAALAVTV